MELYLEGHVGLGSVDSFWGIYQQSFNLGQSSKSGIIQRSFYIIFKLSPPLLNLTMIFVGTIPQPNRVSFRKLWKNIFQSFIFLHQILMHFLNLTEAKLYLILDPNRQIHNPDPVHNIWALSRTIQADIISSIIL